MERSEFIGRSPGRPSLRTSRQISCFALRIEMRLIPFIYNSILWQCDPVIEILRWNRVHNTSKLTPLNPRLREFPHFQALGFWFKIEMMRLKNPWQRLSSGALFLGCRLYGEGFSNIPMPGRDQIYAAAQLAYLEILESSDHTTSWIPQPQYSARNALL